jgi:hypothetical protein
MRTKPVSRTSRTFDDRSLRNARRARRRGSAATRVRAASNAFRTIFRFLAGLTDVGSPAAAADQRSNQVDPERPPPGAAASYFAVKK